MAEYVVLNARQIIRLPQEIPAIHGVFTDAIGYCWYNMFKRSNFNAASQVMIIGSNTFAFILLQLIKKYTGAEVSLATNNPAHVQPAKNFGADHVFAADMVSIISNTASVTKELGYDYVFEMSRDAKMLEAASLISAVKGEIRYSYLYNYDFTTRLGLPELYMKEVSLTPFYLASYTLPLAMKAMSVLNLEDMITDVYKFEDISQAYKKQESGNGIKTIIQF